MSPLAHHHLLELVKVHGARAVLIDLLHDVIKILLRQGVVDLAQNVLQDVVCDEPFTLEELSMLILFLKCGEINLPPCHRS